MPTPWPHKYVPSLRCSFSFPFFSNFQWPGGGLVRAVAERRPAQYHLAGALGISLLFPAPHENFCWGPLCFRSLAWQPKQCHFNQKTENNTKKQAYSRGTSELSAVVTPCRFLRTGGTIRISGPYLHKLKQCKDTDEQKTNVFK